MKYYHDFWGEENGKGVWKREEITKEAAIMLLGYAHNNPCKIVTIAGYYRNMFDAVEIIED